MISKEILFPYQQEAAQRIAEQRRILLADQPGLGKTLEVIGGLELANLLTQPSNILIITPIINAKTAWIDSFERFVKPRYDINLINIAFGTASQKEKAMSAMTDGVNVVIANHNAVDLVAKANRVKSLGLVTWDAIVIDESHMVLPIRDSGKLTLFWKGLQSLRHAEDSMRIAVSGTPDRGKLENRYGTWRFLDPWNMPIRRWDWLETNFFTYEQKVSANRIVRMVGHLRNKEHWIAKDKAWMIRRTKNEVLQQLPPKRYIDIELELSPSQLEAYYEAKEASINGDIDPMVFAIRARQIADCSWDEKWEPITRGVSSKFDWLASWLDERGFIERDEMADNSAKVVIASQFSKVLHWLRAELLLLGIKAEVLDGATPSNKREQIQDDFQNGDLRIVLISGQMGVGITLDAADDLILFDLPYDPDRVEQIEDRVHRASNMHHVTIWTLIATATIDQAIMSKVTKRYQLTRSLLDGARGIDFERQLLEKMSESEDKL